MKDKDCHDFLLEGTEVVVMYARPVSIGVFANKGRDQSDVWDEFVDESLGLVNISVEFA